MNEKPDDAVYSSHGSYSYTPSTTRPPRPRASSAYYRSLTLRRLCIAMCLTLTAWLMTRTVIASYSTSSGELPYANDRTSDAEWVMVEKNTTKVALEAHVMSKCPDAKDCLQKLIVPAMEQINDKVDFRLSYIGSIDANSDEVSCMHGPPECLGNIILLCSAHIYPEVKLNLGFANCMISDFREIPQRNLVEDCAMEHGLDFEEINKCISDEGEGMGLLRDSIERSQNASVVKSCTVRLNGKVRCIRDGGVWKECEDGSSVKDLVADVNELYKKAN